MTVKDLITKVLSDMGQPEDGSGFWTREDCVSTINLVQQEISRECENLISTLNPITVLADATTIDVAGYLSIEAAYINNRPIAVYTESQVADYDQSWLTRKAAVIRGIITGIAGDGKVIPYPIPSAQNTLLVRIRKLATAITAEDSGGNPVNIEIPDVDVPVLENGTKGILYALEKDGKDAAKAQFYMGLYSQGKGGIIARMTKKKEGTYRITKERVDADTQRTRLFYPWEV